MPDRLSRPKPDPPPLLERPRDDPAELLKSERVVVCPREEPEKMLPDADTQPAKLLDPCQRLLPDPDGVEVSVQDRLEQVYQGLDEV